MSSASHHVQLDVRSRVSAIERLATGPARYESVLIEINIRPNFLAAARMRIAAGLTLTAGRAY